MGDPVNILEIRKILINGEKKTTYILKEDALNKYLEPIADKHIAVIPIVGPSRKGKSFILNYMSRYLSGYNKNNWIGERNEPLKGFGWKSSIDPQTTGIWLSKPYIVKPSDGTEIAVILMDTQGVFDEYLDKKDWSTIVGFSLLLSSCLIFNVSADLGEDILTSLETYLKYGQIAAQKHETHNEEKPFQKLFFLIRDWNFPNQFPFGADGGKAFLEEKLKLKEGQAEQAKSNRQLIKSTFEEVGCFLLPYIGDDAQEPDFNGSLEKLSPRFISKLPGLIDHILNPENIDLKKIKGRVVKCRELVHYFKSYVEIFNGTELTAEIIDSATEKVTFFLKVDKFKKKHSKSLKKLLESKGFIPVKLFESEHEKIQNEFIQELEKSVFFTKSEAKNVYEIFKNNHDQILRHMIETRNSIITKNVAKYEALYDQILNEGTGDQWVDANNLLNLFQDSKYEIIEKFKTHFNGEDESVFIKEMYLLNARLSKLDMKYRLRNNELKKENDKINLNTCNQLIQYYSKNMDQVLKERTLLDENSFKKFERDLRQNIISSFEKEVAKHRLSVDLGVKTKLEKDLKSYRNSFKDKFHENQKSFIDEINNQLKSSLESYKRNISEFMETSPTAEGLDKKHQVLVGQSLNLFTQSCITKDDSFLQPFKRKLCDKIDLIFNELQQNAKQKYQEIQNQYQIEADKVVKTYKKEMEEFISNNGHVLDEELKSHNQKLRKDLIDEYRHKFNTGIGVDGVLNEHLWELRDVLDNEFEKFKDLNVMERDKYLFQQKSDELFALYVNTLKQNRDSFNTESELKSLNDRLELKFSEEFKTMRAVSSKVDANLFLDELMRKVNQIYAKYVSELNESHRKINELESLLREVAESYENKMRGLLTNDRYYADSSLDNFHRKYKRDVMKKLTDQLDEKDFDKNNKQVYLDKSERIIENEFEKLCRMNKRRRDEQDNLIGDKIKNYVKLYEFEMNESLDKVECEEELIALHERHLVNYARRMSQQNAINDPDLANIYSNSLKEELNLSFNTFKARSNNQEIKKKIKECHNNYIQKMEQTVESGAVFSKNQLFDSHEKWKVHSCMLFETKLNDNLPANIDKYLTELKTTIDKEFDAIQQNIELKKKSVERQLELKVEEFALNFNKELNKSMTCIQSNLELRESHRTLSNKTLDQFLEKTRNIDKSIVDSFRNQLKVKIEKYIEESLESWKTVSDKNEKLLKLLEIQVRKMYQDEMNKYLKTETYFLDENLVEMNETVLKLLYDRYEGEKGNMADEKYMEFIRESVEDKFKVIKNVNDMNKPLVPAIGIDLGTTNCCMAYVKKNKEIIIPNEFKRNTTPSFVSLRDDEEVIGDPAKEEILYNYKNTIHSAKRLIGRELNDPSVQNYLKLISYDVVDDGCNNPKISVRINRREKTFYPEEISSKLLKKLKQNAENILGCAVTKAVITVPAYFNDKQKDMTRMAGRMAGLEVLKIIMEPTASAMAYSLNHRDDISARNVLIFDFGGGTFDVAVLEVHKGEINVKSVGGDNNLGGDDFDNNIMNYCLQRFTLTTGLVLQPPEKDSAICRLRQECEKHKCKLTDTESTVIQINDFYDKQDLNVVMTRKKFEEINIQLIQKSMDLVDRALDEAKLTHTAIDDIVLVGGTTRIPKVRQLLTQKFNGRPLNQYLDPDEVVARGAAIQAAILNGQQAGKMDYIKLSDVTPMSLGIEIEQDMMSKIIEKNTKVPCSKTVQFQITNDMDSQMTVKVYEGESEFCSQNHALGSFVLNGIRPLRGQNLLSVTFSINEDGLLNVTAKIEGTGVEEVIEIDEYRGRLNNKTF